MNVIPFSDLKVKNKTLQDGEIWINYWINNLFEKLLIFIILKKDWYIEEIVNR